MERSYTGFVCASGRERRREREETRLGKEFPCQACESWSIVSQEMSQMVGRGREVFTVGKIDNAVSASIKIWLSRRHLLSFLFFFLIFSPFLTSIPLFFPFFFLTLSLFFTCISLIFLFCPFFIFYSVFVSFYFFPLSNSVSFSSIF